MKRATPTKEVWTRAVRALAVFSNLTEAEAHQLLLHHRKLSTARKQYRRG